MYSVYGSSYKPIPTFHTRPTYFRRLSHFTVHLQVSIADARKKLRSEFLKHKDVTDVRVIDMLVVKGRMQLEEFNKFWAQSYNAYAYFDDTETQRRIVKEKDDSFLDKFYKSSN